LILSELGERMSAKRSTITGIVDRMERDGLVTRRRSVRDRRVVHLLPTARGLQIAEAVPVSAMEILERALASLRGQDRSELVRILGILAERVRADVASERESGGTAWRTKTRS